MINLDRDERLRLFKFVCSFAWTDLQVTDGERQVVRRMASQLHLDEAGRELVAGWLEVPPQPDEVDPLDIPIAHRRLFVKRAREMVAADGVTHSEADSLAVFEELLST